MDQILVIDDQEAVCYSLKRFLRSEGFTVRTATSGSMAMKAIGDLQPDVIIVDVRMPEMDGFDVLRIVNKDYPKVQVIMMTAFSTTEMAIQAVKSGAYDYVIKPLDNDDLLARIRGALKTRALVEEVVLVEECADYLPGERIIGKSQKMLDIYKQIGKIAPTETAVLVTGESGTGKELVARAIFHHSKRANKAFLAINCAAIPEQLLESELFGYERGAFTGADSKRIGKFEQCNGGTIFLDEIGDMPLLTQAKLLRLLQGGTFQRLGGSETISSNVRIIAATNKSLEEMVQKGTFREDVYFRVSIAKIEIPPLRERREDIKELVHYFIRKYKESIGRDIKGFTAATLQRLEQYSWPGNVRELENSVQKLMVFCNDDFLSSEGCGDLFQQRKCCANIGVAIDNLVGLAFENGQEVMFQDIIAKVEKNMIAKALELTGGNQVRAAQLLGISRNTLRKKLDK